MGISLCLDSAPLVSELPLHRKGAAIYSGNSSLVVRTMVFFSDVLLDGQEGVRSWEGEGGEASVCGFNYKKGIKPPMLASGVESDLNKLMFYCGNLQHVCCIYNKRNRRQRQINKLSFPPNIREVIIGEIGLSEQMTARSFLSTQKRECEGHLYPG